MFAASTAVANTGRVGKVASFAHNASSGRGKAGMAVAAARQSGALDSAEAQQLKGTASGTASQLWAALGEAGAIVAAGANARTAGGAFH